MKKQFIAGGILLAVLVYIVLQANGGRNDFNIYMRGAIALFKDNDVYATTYFDGYHYYYSLLFALFIYPLTYLPVSVAKFIWLAANVFFLYRLIKLIASYFDVSPLTVKKKWLLFILCFAFGLEFLLLNFRYGQVTICILYLALEGVNLIFSSKKFAGALLIALGINIKILPVVLLPYLMYRKELKASILIALAYVAFMFLPAIVIGFHRNVALLVSWVHLIDPMNKAHVLDVGERSFHSLSTLLATLLIANLHAPHALPIKRNIANISPTQLMYVLNAVRLALICFAFYFFRTRPFVRVNNMLHRLWEVGYLLLLIPLIFPHQQEYAFLFVTPAACYIIYYLVAKKNTISIAKFRLLAIGLLLSYFACNCSFLLGQFNAYYEHFKILTYGALLLIPMLAACVPPVLTAKSIKAN